MVPRLIMIMKIWSLMTHFYGAPFQGHYFCRNNVYVNSELLINVQYMSSLFFFILTTDIFLKLHTFFSQSTYYKAKSPQNIWLEKNKNTKVIYFRKSYLKSLHHIFVSKNFLTD